MTGAYLTLPDNPFTYADLDALGISRHNLRRLVTENVVRRLVRGVYVRADLRTRWRCGRRPSRL